MEDVASEIESIAVTGNPHAQSLLGFLYNTGMSMARNGAKAFMYHHFAADSGNTQSKLARAYTYSRQEAKEYFEKAADNEEAGGHYNLGVMYLKGIGVKKDVKLACKYFLVAANAGQPKAFYQLAKMFHTGIGLKKNLPMATSLYKLVAERGPWNSLSRWALESYLKGEIGKAFLLYSRMAELGYEVAQSNAACLDS